VLPRLFPCFDLPSPPLKNSFCFCRLLCFFFLGHTGSSPLRPRSNFFFFLAKKLPLPSDQAGVVPPSFPPVTGGGFPYGGRTFPPPSLPMNGRLSDPFFPPDVDEIHVAFGSGRRPNFFFFCGASLFSFFSPNSPAAPPLSFSDTFPSFPRPGGVCFRLSALFGLACVSQHSFPLFMRIYAPGSTGGPNRFSWLDKRLLWSCPFTNGRFSPFSWKSLARNPESFPIAYPAPAVSPPIFFSIRMS